MCANLELYNRIKAVPSEAKKPIAAGRLKGKTDINPMWRIKMLTQEFGVCGFGWKTTIDKLWIEEGANGERAAHVQISLYVRDKDTGEWSDAIVGIGGAAFISSEKNGMFTDDDCYKKAYTDAISIACKALGMAADVYYEKDPDSKYQKNDSDVVPFSEVERTPMTYEQALTVLYNGVALRDVYKNNRQAIRAIYEDPATIAQVKDAILIINAKILENAKAKGT